MSARNTIPGRTRGEINTWENRLELFRYQRRCDASRRRTNALAMQVFVCVCVKESVREIHTQRESAKVRFSQSSSINLSFSLTHAYPLLVSFPLSSDVLRTNGRRFDSRVRSPSHVDSCIIIPYLNAPPPPKKKHLRNDSKSTITTMRLTYKYML
jgi:hypothetical protein